MRLEKKLHEHRGLTGSAADLAAIMGCSVACIHSHARQGKIVKVERGLYAVPEAAEEPAAVVQPETVGHHVTLKVLVYLAETDPAAVHSLVEQALRSLEVEAPVVARWASCIRPTKHSQEDFKRRMDSSGIGL